MIELIFAIFLILMAIYFFVKYFWIILAVTVIAALIFFAIYVWHKRDLARQVEEKRIALLEQAKRKRMALSEKKEQLIQLQKELTEQNEQNIDNREYTKNMIKKEENKKCNYHLLIE